MLKRIKRFFTFEKGKTLSEYTFIGCPPPPKPPKIYSIKEKKYWVEIYIKYKLRERFKSPKELCEWGEVICKEMKTEYESIYLSRGYLLYPRYYFVAVSRYYWEDMRTIFGSSINRSISWPTEMWGKKLKISKYNN